MSRIPRICRRPGVLAGVAPVLPSAAAAPAALANPEGAASMSAGVSPALGWLSFRRIVDIPFEACVAVLESWQRTGQDGEVRIGQSRLRGPIKEDRDSGTCRIEARRARGPLRSLLRMQLDIDRWSSSPSSTAFELIPCGRVRPTAAYFRAGHRLLDSLTHSLPRHVPTQHLAASQQPSHTRITADPFLVNGCQEQTTLRGQTMTGPIFQRRAMAKTGRRRSFPTRPAAVALALSAALAIPALTVSSGSVMAATAARAAAHQVHQNRPEAGQAVTVGISAAGTTSRTVLAWGRNTTGQLGDGTTTSTSIPVKVHLPAGTEVTQVRAGCADTLALTAVGHVLAWGSNSDGQLGDGRITDSATPVRVKLPRGTKITAIRAGCEHSLALTSKGQVLAWGYNHGGELGNGSTADSDVPVRVRLPRHTKVTAVSAGQYFSLARTAKGQVLAWGDNDSGELGNGSTASSDVPVRVALPAGVRATAVSAEEETSLARTSGGGGLFGWGDNSLGQLGDGTTTSSDTPVSIPILMHGPSLGHPVSLFGGCGHTVALFSSGKVLAWGSNVFGQLGDGTTTSTDTPVAVMLPASTKVTAISAGCATSYALTRNGRMLAWGLGATGELGDGSITSSNTPVWVDLPNGWRASAVGSGPMAAHALAIVHKKA